ncbi:adenylate/guanylate cyclase domain-containing protein [Mycolicibacterium arenosum]|uniref:Adenylate/guanylate cyclase domain-containing protein n=1 Tax=Mycolicibacterium arenosum TaxID=2952157 RepID=A0ABT1LWC9_9MYCO|nr:adenylate/guanylate cyclase domain-containing protein [Mycolicibacterium sp. CAU 1645]MCP9271209.1 adenylate/guanylate cyclase domain-containing protein [Mycolicibacterium sp. CAU 1645]
MPTINEFAELGLLDGLEGNTRDERVDLIVWLLAQGFTVEQVRSSVSTPLLLPTIRVLGDDRLYVSLRELNAATGMDVELLNRLIAAAGLPRPADLDTAVLLQADADAIARAKVFIGMGVTPDETVAVLRALTEGLGHAAEMMRDSVLNLLLVPGEDEIEFAEASQAFAQRARPELLAMIGDLFLMRLRSSLESEAITAAERAAGQLPGARHVTVAFADVVGFTELGEQLSPYDLERLARRLADTARTATCTPVRFVKSVGDAVMLVSPEPTPLLTAVLDLAEAASADDLPPLRIGVASGSAVTRAGDWFGSPVNLASRVTAVARPGTVLVAESTQAIVEDTAGIQWSAVGSRRLKGVSNKVNLFRARRASTHE